MTEVLTLGDETCRLCRRAAGPVCAPCIKKYKLTSLTCATCGQAFLGGRGRLYCSDPCRVEAKFERGPSRDISSKEIERRFAAAKAAIKARRKYEQPTGWW